MKRKSFSKGLFNTTLFCSILFCFTACTNKISEDADTEIEEGTIPISFSVRMKRATSKATGTTFEKGDRMGLFAITPSSSMKGKRYIDNLSLEYTEGSTLMPKKTVFYPEGNIPLDFISYYPYQSDGVQAGTSMLAISVQADQSVEKNRSQSDFLVAKAKKITNKNKTVMLEFKHKLAKLTITLIPDENNTANDLLKANPRIIATGFKTSANYDLQEETFSNLNGTKDIIASGEWTVKDNKLTGKEIIIIPQDINQNEHFFIMEWGGRIYSCAIPHVEISSNTQCPINISAMQGNNVLEGFAGQIKEWDNIAPINTDNKADYTAVHVSALSFSQTNIYRVYHEGLPVAEVCKEYLVSNLLTSRAIIAYPLGENEKADLSKGIVMQLADCTEAICGGKICWDTNGQGFTYTNGNAASIDLFYIDAAHNLSLEKPENAVKVNVAGHSLLDIRKGAANKYPITKIGKQYWMGKELRATAYRDGTPLTKQTELGKDKAGYYKPDNYEIYFYNGEAVLAGELAPEGWKIPSDQDWEELKSYLGNDAAATLKAGEWQTMISGKVVPVNNYAQFNAFPVGMWYQGIHYSPWKMTAFWSWDKARNTLSDNTVYFLGETNNFVRQPARITGKEYYKALSIRCIKE